MNIRHHRAGFERPVVRTYLYIVEQIAALRYEPFGRTARKNDGSQYNKKNAQF